MPRCEQTVLTTSAAVAVSWWPVQSNGVKYDYFLVMMNDVVWDAGVTPLVTPLVELMESNPHIGLLAPTNYVISGSTCSITQQRVGRERAKISRGH